MYGGGGGADIKCDNYDQVSEMCHIFVEYRCENV